MGRERVVAGRRRMVEVMLGGEVLWWMMWDGGWVWE